eukprot:CAMPEP_0183776668 /NCGR_PEP_ID=MMETSP0739-20130205/47333_1 /TAXON_ID=385413 /ORGANISM="Thalassiosira miniscula, Strain CCMP1093" /LENGTH=38 /DNA_ID= /DNA_START= /DNA_END= /DNA_ORIENTATION=
MRNIRISFAAALAMTSLFRMTFMATILPSGNPAVAAAV